MERLAKVDKNIFVAAVYIRCYEDREERAMKPFKQQSETFMTKIFKCGSRSKV